MVTHSGNIEVMKTLLEHGADVNGRVQNSETALHEAIRRGKFK